MTSVKTPAEITALRKAGKILAETLRDLEQRIEPGVSAKSLSKRAGNLIRNKGGEPVFFGYHGFPEPICISINDEVVHGIPRDTGTINEGDVVSLDLGVRYKGMIADSAITVVCGDASPEIAHLLEYTKRSLDAGISVVRDGVRTGDIGAAIEAVLKAAKLGVVRDLVGHGVGHDIHEEPNIPNYGRKNTGATLRSGMTVAIEPMATLGKEAVFTDVDGWTVKTRDGSLAAHFEHTVLVTDDGAEILTC